MTREPVKANPGASSVDGPDPEPVRRTILELCGARGPGRSIDPSEAARALGGDPNDVVPWRVLIRRIRVAAAELQDEGRIVVLRKGKPVDIRAAKGVIRLALPASTTG